MKKLLMLILCLGISGCATLSIPPDDQLSPIEREKKRFDEDMKKFERPPDIRSYYQENNFISYTTINRAEWQTPQETIERRSGDCKDYALLNQYFLSKMGIKATTYIVKFREISIMHAVCVFMYNYKYYVFSNRDLYETSESTALLAIKQIYADTEEVYCAK